MGQSGGSSFPTDRVTRVDTSVEGTSLPNQNTISVHDISTSTMDQSGDSSLFLAKRAARVNARSRANQIYGITANIDTTSTSIIDLSPLSVHSSEDTTTWSPLSYSSHSKQQSLQKREMSIDITHYPDGLFATNYSNELSISLDEGNGSIADSLSSLPDQFGWNGDWIDHQTEYSMRSSNIEFESILPSTWAFSPFTAPLAPIARPQSKRDASLADSREGLLSHTAARTNLPVYASRRLEAQENALAARRSRTISLISHNSSSDSTITSRGSNNSRDANNCSYCISVNKFAIGHNKHNCPVLADLPPCRICQATGKYNHTESHCPFQEKTDLEFIPKERRRAYTC